MYNIIKDGNVLALTERPNYIRLHGNGSYVLCPEPEAQGIAHNGEVYHLLGRPGLEGTDTVMLVEIDAGPELLQVQQGSIDTDALCVDQEYRLTLLELGINEIGEVKRYAVPDTGKDD